METAADGWNLEKTVEVKSQAHNYCPKLVAAKQRREEKFLTVKMLVLFIENRTLQKETQGVPKHIHVKKYK